MLLGKCTEQVQPKLSMNDLAIIFRSFCHFYWRERQTDKQTDTETDRIRDTETDRQTDRQTETERQSDLDRQTKR